MKKESYEKAAIEVELFETVDVICDSGDKPGNDGGTGERRSGRGVLLIENEKLKIENYGRDTRTRFIFWSEAAKNYPTTKKLTENFC